MSENNNSTGANEATEKNEPELDINKLVNQAVSSQLKRELKKFQTELLATIKPAAAIEEAEDEADETETALEPKAKSKAQALSPDIAKILKKQEAQDRKIKELEAREKAQKEALRAAKAQREIGTALKGKVADDWADIAEDMLLKRVSFGSDDSPIVKIGDEEYSLSDGVEEFLKDSANKRFLPAPKIAQRQTIKQNPAVITLDKTKKLSTQEKHAIAAELIANRER